MTIKNLSWPVVLVGTVLVMLLVYTHKLPNNVMGAYGLMFILGIVFGEIGSRVSVIRNWLGGGPIMCIFGPSLMIYFGMLPPETIGLMKDFMKGSPSFFNFFITFLICGAMLSISRRILLQSTLKFLPTVLAAIFGGCILAAIGGVVTGYGAVKAVMLLAVPIIGGGVGAGALPLSQIYSQSAAMTTEQMLSVVMPAVVLGNILAILFAIALNRVGKKYPGLTGNGQIMKIDDSELRSALESEKAHRDSIPVSIEGLGVGFFISVTFYLAAFAINRFLVPSVHTFVWLILLLTIAKAAKVLPESLEVSTIHWSQTWVRNLLFAALVPIGIAYMDMEQVISAVSNPAYVIISVLTVLGCLFGAGLIGMVLKLFFVESSIAGGLCMANMAQTGDLATLAAADRLELLPYSAYASRIGGSIVLVLAGLLVSAIGLGM
ncbi:MAG: 2-hydroxycarboxylate transporter family protein [Pseudodesulfovibrio sp.]|uniref:2-hydroxycarboxylate transporter family protein n=1 Tax=Pseudodesulfovibrio sp. TaxID=2035812 RepID=UPI003D12A68E